MFYRRDALSVMLGAQLASIAANLAQGMRLKLEQDRPDFAFETVPLVQADSGRSRYSYRPKRRPGKYSLREWGRATGKVYPYGSGRQGYI